MYRTGSLWAHSNLPVDCHPDIITVAKPLANGYPIGAVLLRDNIAASMTVGQSDYDIRMSSVLLTLSDNVGTHGTTFGGSPLACALGYHVLGRLSDRSFVSHLVDTSAHLVNRLKALPSRFPEILHPDVRGAGLILGLGFKQEDGPKRVVSMARERGLLLLTAGKDALRLVPSLNIGEKEVDEAVDVIEDCLRSL